MRVERKADVLSRDRLEELVRESMRLSPLHSFSTPQEFQSVLSFAVHYRVPGLHLGCPVPSPSTPCLKVITLVVPAVPSTIPPGKN